MGDLDAAAFASTPGGAVAARAGAELREYGFRLPLQLKQMGDAQNCRHRSGWRYVMERLRSYHTLEGILLDDFVERSFQHSYCRQEWREPWVGIFHHPPGLPSWLDPSAPPDAIFGLPEFRNSLPYLRGAIALSNHLGRWLESRLGCPVLVVRHPTEAASAPFSLEAFEAEPRRRMVQVGWYGRNQRAIYQVPTLPSFRKIHLLQDRPWVREAIARTDALSPLRGTAHVGQVEVVQEISNEEYDRLLSASMIFNQYWDVSASNTIIEAIARGTPILVNRHVALEEYLGLDYPLYYDAMADVEHLLRDGGAIAAASEHIAALDKSWMSAESFARSVAQFAAEVAND